MANLIKAASDWLADKLKGNAAESVVYVRAGASSAALSARIGSSTFEVDTGSGLLLAVQSRDYLIETADLVINSAVIEPRAGDLIREGDVTYRVADFGSEPAWRWSDPFRKVRRIHTKLVK